MCKIMEKEKITGAEALMRSLEHEGVKTIFGYPGGAIMPVFDVLYDYRDQINHILVRHEQGATHAAQGYAQESGIPASLNSMTEFPAEAVRPVRATGDAGSGFAAPTTGGSSSANSSCPTSNPAGA